MSRYARLGICVVMLVGCSSGRPREGVPATKTGSIQVSDGFDSAWPIALGMSDYEFQGSIESLANVSDTVALIRVAGTVKERYLDGGGDPNDPNECCWSSIYEIEVIKTLKGPETVAGPKYLGIMESEAILLAGETVIAFLLTRKQSAFSWVTRVEHDFYAMASTAEVSSFFETSPNQYGRKSKSHIKPFTKDVDKHETLTLEQFQTAVKNSKKLRPWELEDIQKSLTPTTVGGINQSSSTSGSSQLLPASGSAGEVGIVD
jgi:hypothetical protein